MPKIIVSRPPNYADIREVFPMAANEGVIFAYAPNIYVPSGASLPPELIAHESVHIQRQLAIGVELWWEKYLTDLPFRYEEELLAHRAEYQALCELQPNRQGRRSNLKHVAKKLSAGLYNKMVSFDQACKDLTA